ncbi:MAG TPA: amidohydrolase family protein [Xanthomonadaceae bacterium]|nr:amidohydrolase family protein [Xanthomonadaceae bacterium]
MNTRVPLALACLLLPTHALAQTTLVACGDLFDAERAALAGPHTIVVRDGRIAEVRAGAPAPASGERVVDLSAHTCLPGLIDSHVHLRGQTSRQAYSEGFRLDPEDYAFRAVGYAATTLQAGFTTVRDLGGSITPALRDAIDQGHIQGPRIFAAGTSIATTGGHADPTNGISRELADALGYPGPEDGVISGQDQARRAVRQRYKEGSDLIKITATGGVLSFAKNSQNPQFTVDEIRAIVETARDYGYKVAAHAHGDEGMQRAVLGGVDSIEHGTYMSEQTMKMMKESGTWYVPTISAGVFVGEMAVQPDYYPEIVRPKALAVGPLIAGTFGRAYRAGVPIAFGTDAGVFPHGDNAREFVLMVEAGMPANLALQSATRNAAQLLGEWDNLGSIAPGKHADIVAVRGDPLQDISLMRQVQFVMKGGTVHKSPAPQ